MTDSPLGSDAKKEKKRETEEAKLREKEGITKLAQSMQAQISKLLRNKMDVRADISRAVVYDVMDRWNYDMRRILANNSSGVRPSKHVAFLAFWIRKLKPVSHAVPARSGDIPDGMRYSSADSEILGINEHLAIWLAFERLENFVRNGKVEVADRKTGNPRVITYDKDKFSTAVAEFCGQRLSPGGKTVIEVLVEDMRYRTFGPHHLVHLFDQFVFALGNDGFSRDNGTQCAA